MGAFGAALTARMHYEDIADDDNAHVGADGRSVDAAAAEESAAGDEPNAAAHAGEIVVDGDCQRIAEQVTAFGRDDPPQPAVIVVDGVGVDRFVVIERAAQQRPPQSVGEALHDMIVGIGRHGA